MRIEGGLSVKAAMQGGVRKVERIYIDSSKKDKDAMFIRRTAHDMRISVAEIKREKIDEMAEGRTHGGILADVNQRRMQSLASCLAAENPFLALVEGVEDPFNLGYIMRSLYCAGCTGILLRSRSWQDAGATILRSSAGASEFLPTVMPGDLADAVKQCKEAGLTVYAAMRKDAEVYDEADYRKPCLIAIGGEMRGLSKGILEQADRNVYIPYTSSFRNALNAASAAAVFGFEVQRQRRHVHE